MIHEEALIYGMRSGECFVPTWPRSHCVEAEDGTTINMNCSDNGKWEVKNRLPELAGGLNA